MLANTEKPSAPGSVGLIIDYSNGVQKSFMGIPWNEGMEIIALLKAAGSIRGMANKSYKPTVHLLNQLTTNYVK